MVDKSKILSSREERELNKQELLIYYKELRNYLISTKPENITKGSLTICPVINPIIRKILECFCGYEIIVEGAEKIDGLVGIYAHTHQSNADHINLIASNPNHTILLNSSVLSILYKLVLCINGVIYVDKFDKESKNNAKTEMIRLLLQGTSITMFPESAWNCSPNKLHLPLYIGMVDIAKKAQVPIIPVVQEYIYDESKFDGKERIRKVIISYGEPIYVSEDDKLLEKLDEYSESISTMRWNLIERKGMYERKQISNSSYINFLKGIVRNLKNAGIDIEIEKKGIFGADDDFYLFHHLNAVDYDEKNNLLPTQHVRRLIRLFDENNKKNNEEC